MLVASVEAINRRQLQVTKQAWFLPVVIVVGVLILCCLSCQIFGIRNKGVIAKKRAEFEALSKMADTKEGSIEYRVWGNAPYMLFMPGTPGFCQTTVGFDKFGFGLVTVSRPGYGRTPMKPGLETTTGQAKLLLALMTDLGHEKFPMLCASGAGIIGLRIAQLAPERVQALALCCATTGKLDHPLIGMFERQEGKDMMVSPTAGVLGAKFMPGMADKVIAGDLMTANNQKAGTFTQKEADAIAKLKVKSGEAQGMIDGMEFFAMSAALYPESYDTMLVDMIYYREDIPFDQIKVPVHHIHGNCDDDINYSQAE